jgi:phosphoglycerate kinase
MDKLVINQLPVEKLRGKRVFVRIDVGAEQTITGAFLDDSKLRASIPTIEYLSNIGARVIIGTHIGEGVSPCVDSLRLDPVAERLSALLGKPVLKLNDMVGRDVLQAVLNMRNGEILMLENLFFYHGEFNNDPEFAHELARLADVYCNDAFGLASKGFASTVGITRFIEPSTAGLTMARDITLLETLINRAEHPFVGVIAGSRIEEKMHVLENLLLELDRLFIGGALSFTFLKAKGFDVGAAAVEEEFLPMAERLLRKAEGKLEILLPKDFIVVDSEEFGLYTRELGKLTVPRSRSALVNEISPTELPVDIGPVSINLLKELFDSAHSLFWNGPLGIWQIQPFNLATREMAKYLIEGTPRNYQRSILCGDSLVRAVRSFNLNTERIRHLMTGGESAIQMLAGNPLPGVSALSDRKETGEPKAKKLKRILVPVDGSKHSLEVTRKLGFIAGAEDVEITLLYVSKPPFGSDQVWIDPEEGKERKVEERFEAEKIFAEVNAELAGQGLISHRQLMVEGNPAEEILKCSEEIGADLIAMGSHGRTGLLRFLMGSVSRKVSDYAKCPVLIVRIPDKEMVKAGLTEAA